MEGFYSNDIRMLWRELLNLLHSHFGLSIMEAMDVGEPLALAAMKFESIRSGYKSKVLPDLDLAYTRLKEIAGTICDPKRKLQVLSWNSGQKNCRLNLKS